MVRLHVLNGPQAGRAFELREVANYIGRASADIEIKDPTVSRNHLKVTLRRGRYYITDLESRNHTFFNGKYLSPVLEYEVKEGIPIAIGLTVLCIEKDDYEDMAPFMDSTAIPRETEAENGEYTGHEQRTDKNKLLMLYNICDVLTGNLNVRVTCRKILDHILGLLKRIDRGVFVLIDPITKEITEAISKPDDFVGRGAMSYMHTIVERVSSSGHPLVISNVRMEKDHLAEMLKKRKIESLLCVPMSSKSKTVGFLYLDSLRTSCGFRLEDVALFLDLCQRVALAIDYTRIAPHQEETDHSKKS